MTSHSSSQSQNRVIDEIFVDQTRRWCLFTSAGDRNAIRLWLKGNAVRPWDLVVAYYGDNDDEFAELQKLSDFCYRSRGFKYQNLKRLVSEHPHFLDRYSHVWACDDDIIMSTLEINEAFQLTETLGFWVAQPAVLGQGRNSHWITCLAGSGWDYRIVNFVESGIAIFRRDKLTEFLAVYDGSLAGWGICDWYANLFQANEFGRFAIIDKVRVINPRHQDKGGGEIERFIPSAVREAQWNKVRQRYGLVEYPHKVFAYCKLAPDPGLLRIFLPMSDFPPVTPPWLEAFRRSGWRAEWLVKGALVVRVFLQTASRSGWRSAFWFLKSGLIIRRQRQMVNYL